ncbi:interferon-induced helicase C domain-containing protein 1-like [Pecten maximus]|uniref:interferon-induced helicase C domain-containing protein 1-like n=1 Tax=Pecten maximus TaxID=6579 RepID=UPI0014587494|nr:interferon-induced helicase C domain-containing protein 1-like [Pecten maximus]XP_033726224.1 interferon-induced helicase C domain-containing protein 1-like [Pecten maximus]
MKISGRDHMDGSFSDIIKDCRVCVITPMSLEGYLKRQASSLDAFSMLVFDECHHTRKSEPYNQIMAHYRKRHKEGGTLPQVIGLTASVGTERANDVRGAEESIIDLMARMNVTKITTPKVHVEEYHNYVPDPIKHKEVMTDRKVDPIGDTIQRAMYRLEGWLVGQLCDLDTDIDSLLREIPDTQRMKPQYQTWLSRLQMALPLSKQLAPDMKHRAIVITDHLTMYQSALSLNNTLCMKDVLEHLYLSSLKFKILGKGDNNTIRISGAREDIPEGEGTQGEDKEVDSGQTNTGGDEINDRSILGSTRNDDIHDKPSLESTGNDEIHDKPSLGSTGNDDIHDKLCLGSTGNDDIHLHNKQNVDSTESDGINDKPSLGSAESDGINDKPNLNSTGSDDIHDKPSIGSAESDDIHNKPSLGSTGNDDIHDKPSLNSTGSADIHDKPSLNSTGSDDRYGNPCIDSTVIYSRDSGTRLDSTGSDVREVNQKVSNTGNEATNVSLYTDVVKELERLSQNPDFENPNIVRLQEMVDKHIKEKGMDSTFIVFIQTRESAIAVSRYLREKSSNVKCRYLISARSTTEDIEKQSHAEQSRVVKQLLAKQINGIVATQVAEEGLDMPACNFVIRYNRSSDEISTLQAAGRSRKVHGTIIDFADQQKGRQEQMNVLRLELMNEALKNILAKSDAEIQEKVTQRMRSITETDLEEERMRVAQKNSKPIGNFTLRCQRCQEFAVCSSDIRCFMTSQYIVTNSEFYRRIKRRLHKNPKNYAGLNTKYKIECKNCGSDWGVGACPKTGVFCAVLKIKQFVVTDADTGLEYNTSSWAKLPFTVQPMYRDELHNLTGFEDLTEQTNGC